MANFSFKSLVFLLQKRTYSSPPPSFSAKCLLESCGVSLKCAKTLQNLESVISFLKLHGFEKTHMAKIIGKYPRIARISVDTSLKPTVEYLVDTGFTGSRLPELLVRNPFILRETMRSRIKPSMDFLKIYLEPEGVVTAVLNYPRILHYDVARLLQPNIDLLEKEGVPVYRIAKLIALCPGFMLTKSDKTGNAVKTAKELGFKPSEPAFTNAVKVLSWMSDSTWKNKVEIFKSLGWSEEDVLSTFRSLPQCLALSEKNLREKMDFFVNTVKLKPENVIACPTLLTCSVDKRLRPRHNIFKILVEGNLLKEDTCVSFSSFFIKSEVDFLEDFVIKHLDQIPGLLEIYQNNGVTKECGI